MQRFAHIVFAIFMLVHALVPALPVFVCTDGGRSLSPCSPPQESDPSSPNAAWNLEDCCKLTAPAVVDASPPASLSHSHNLAVLFALLPVPQHSFLSPLSQRRNDPLSRGDPALRRPPPSLHTILRI